MAEAVITVNGLAKSFASAGFGRHSQETLAVNDVSFSVERGGALAIVGESGSGKTTVARCLVGLEVPTSGSIEVCGEDWASGGDSAGERRRRARKIQLVFQDPYQSLDPRQKVGEALHEALRVHGISRGSARTDSVGDLLDRVGLSPRWAVSTPAFSPAGSVSGLRSPGPWRPNRK